ncbi:serine protease inhibitor 42Dd [Drosophila subobscura]|uniref:serine protease inhibitor 42Dd n=1 Tax=Drosophila subobscura TaxID=7241 RepID=UPI00155B3209|nr:serine protease inhibitor 42Dd [Drosophila subobscura]
MASMTALFLLLLLGSILSMVQSDGSAGDTKFALKLFGALAKNNSLKNIVFSPSSIRTSLVLAYLGSEGTTENELKQTLSLEGADKNEVAKGFAQLLAKGQNPQGAQFSYANRIYVAKRFGLVQSYQELVGKYFNAPAEKVNFEESAKVAQEINSWVEEKTHHQIKDLISSSTLDSYTVALLINAIYFKANWVNPFSLFTTILHPFVSSEKKTVRVSTMFQTEFFKYAELPSLKAKALEMPYKGTDIVFLIILPLEEQGLAELEEKLSGVELNEICSQLKTEHVRLQLPKFKMEFDVSLNPVLEQLGLKQMFSENANFKSLVQQTNMHISEVKHKAFIDLNEAGTTAAAATYVKGAFLSANRRKTYPFIVDHPFLFAIKDDQNTFFLGHYTQPK